MSRQSNRDSMFQLAAMYSEPMHTNQYLARWNVFRSVGLELSGPEGNGHPNQLETRALSKSFLAVLELRCEPIEETEFIALNYACILTINRFNPNDFNLQMTFNNSLQLNSAIITLQIIIP